LNNPPVEPIGRFKHEARAFDDILIGEMKHKPNSTHEIMIWNFEDKDPNKKILMGLQYALQKCPNMKSVIFHIDGIFPYYDMIHRHLINKHFEGIYCLGDVKPVNDVELKRLRSHGKIKSNHFQLSSSK